MHWVAVLKGSTDLGKVARMQAGIGTPTKGAVNTNQVGNRQGRPAAVMAVMGAPGAEEQAPADRDRLQPLDNKLRV